MNNIYSDMGVNDEVYAYCEKIIDSLKPRFDAIDKNAEINQLKVIKAMQKNQVSEACLLGTTGYGYDDIGRNTLERVYADIFPTKESSIAFEIPLMESLSSNTEPLQFSP